MRIKTFVYLGLCAFVMSAVQLKAGVVYTLNSKDFQDPTNSGKMTVLVEGQNLKIMMKDMGDGGGSMIFKGNEKAMIIVDDERRQYFVMDQATVAKLAAQMNQAMAEYQKMLENVPPQQRAMMEQMMKQQMGNMMPQMASPAKTELSKGGKDKTISGYKTIHYQEKSSGLLENEFWVADWDKVKGGEEVMEAFMGMAKFQEDLMEAMSSGGSNPFMGMVRAISDNMFKKLSEMEGFPVASTNYDRGVKSSETILESVEKKELDSTLFSPPKGYKRQSMDMR